MFIRNQQPLGSLGQDVTDLSAYSDESTITGLPVYAEIGLGVLGVIALSKLLSAAQSAGKKIKKKTRALLA